MSDDQQRPLPDDTEQLIAWVDAWTDEDYARVHVIDGIDAFVWRVQQGGYK